MLAAGFGAFFAKKLNWAYFFAASAIVLLLAAQIPSWYMSPELRATNAMTNRMRDLQSAIESWGNEHGRFPLNDQEFRQAIGTAKLDGGESPFQRAGKTVPYKSLLMVVRGPLQCNDAPGMLCYTVDSSGTHYWITGTTLPAPISRDVSVVAEKRDGPDYVLTGEVEPPSPQVAPAKTKIETKK